MANAFYGPFKYKLGAPGTLGSSQGDSVDLLDDTIKVALVDTGTYTFSSAHEFYSSVSSAVVGTPQTLASKTLSSAGVFDAADVTFSSVTGSSVEALVLYKDTGSAATSPLICYLDSVSAGLPVTPNSGSIGISWDNTGIFVL